MNRTGATLTRGFLSFAVALLFLSGLGVVDAGLAVASTAAVQEDGHEAEAHEVGGGEGQADDHGEQGHGEEAGQADAHAATDEHADEHGAAEHGEEEHGETWLQIGYRWINFFLLLGLLWWLLVIPPPFVMETFSFPGLKVLLRDRSAGIIESRDLADRQVAEAAEIVQASQQRLERISEEIDALLVEARTDAEQELARAETAGLEAAERVKGTGARDLASREVSAVRGLRTHAADTVVEMARRILTEHFRGEDQERLVRDYLDRLGEQVQ